ncbi:MAG: hypothetical protein IIZ83_05080 [Oscillospiraceae bacterium]|nr:hypothetical protein [Oscillospiraceae bacterium]
MSILDRVDKRMKEVTPLDIECLREENELLREENTRLRRRLADEIEKRLALAERFAINKEGKQ